jgi:hypothetical protein
MNENGRFITILNRVINSLLKNGFKQIKAIINIESISNGEIDSLHNIFKAMAFKDKFF